MNVTDIIRDYYDQSVEIEWERIDNRPEFLITCRYIDRYVKAGDKVLDIGEVRDVILSDWQKGLRCYFVRSLTSECQLCEEEGSRDGPYAECSVRRCSYG